MAGATRGGDCGKRKTRATLTDAKKRVHKKKLAETAIETSQERLTSNNKAMSSFFQRFTVNEEDNSAHQINENDLEINPTDGGYNIDTFCRGWTGNSICQINIHHLWIIHDLQLRNGNTYPFW